MIEDVHFDIETRSRIDLTVVGADRYGCDPSTEIFMGAVGSSDPASPVYLWVNPKFHDAGIPSDAGAEDMLKNAKRVHAHNTGFEQPVCAGTNMFTHIGLDQWRCTQAMARMAGLPESLENCGEALNIKSKKSPRGKALIRFFSQPREEDGQFNEPRDHRAEWAEFCEYCRQDVRAEREIHAKLKHRFSLVDENLATYQFTMRMNHMGIPVNVPALKNAQSILTEVQSGIVTEFRELTGLNPTQRAKVLEMVRGLGVDIDNMQADTLENPNLTKDIADKANRERAAKILDLYSKVSYAATKKITTMLAWACPDNRLHGVLKFYGAGTGRWSAGGPQIQNAKKATPAMRPITHAAFAYIAKGGTAAGIDAIYGDPIEVLASCVRHFVGDPNCEILDGDYNAIEARIACWVSGEVEALEEYRRGVDRYRTMAAYIYNITIDKVTSDQREVGKRAILGLGYGMGAEKFMTSCRDMYGIDISLELSERAKVAFREKHSRMAKCWRTLDNAIVAAIQRPQNPPAELGRLRVHCERTAGMLYLFITLPSGRRLAYPLPEIVADDQFGQQITYWGQIPGSTRWGRIKLYGAKAFENVCQAIAADVMSHGARKAESLWMLPFALIHDQGLALRLKGQTADQFSAALATLPAWAQGLPLKVESKIMPYYSK
jgi:DNA polymerase